MNSPKVFFSYSWESVPHIKWVYNLATDLRSDGIETILDQWDMAPGDQLTAFMEKQIRESDYVLVICTPGYKLKSNERQGGVGYEGDLITAEIYAKNNHDKFIPILVQDTWENSAPSWLKGARYIDMSTQEKREKNYAELVDTLLRRRAAPPPLRSPSKSAHRQPIENASSEEEIKIIGVIADQVTEPELDGTRGSALYDVPLQLNRRPSRLWSDIFERTWDHPPSFTLMHRPGIVRVLGKTIVLRDTRIEEVRDVHRRTLILCVDKANKEESRILEERRKEEERLRQQSEEHRKTVRDVADDISFD